MRVLCALFLIGFVAVVGLFAYQNDAPAVVNLFGTTKETTVPILVGSAYLIGMLSGWTVIGMLRRSWRRVADFDRV